MSIRKACENCIGFDDIAPVYDETRPFKKHGDSKVLRLLCETIIERFKSEKYIKILDAGTGTGRIAFPFYEIYKKVAERGQAPNVKMDCIDVSEEMLNVFRDKKKKISKTAINDISFEINEELKDVRWLHDKKDKYHVVFAHWIFHVIYDWRVAIYALDKSIKREGMLVLFNENSDLYDAIDGDYENTSDHHNIYELWSEYHRSRQERTIENFENSTNSELPPARFRLGSMVVDERVKQMFQILGWEKSEHEFDEKWSANILFFDIVNNIIKRRAFTNMRLSGNQEMYENIAEDICRHFRDLDALRGYRWSYKCTFSASIYLQKAVNSRDPFDDALVDVLRDTIGRGYMRKSQFALNITALWKVGFSCAWERMHESEKGRNPFFGVKTFDEDKILLVYANAPFIGDGKEDRSVCVMKNENCDPKKIDNIWSGLVNEMEVYDPIEYVYDGSCRAEGSDLQLHPYVRRLDVPEAVICNWNEAIAITDPHERMARELDVLHEPSFKDFLKNVRRNGVLSYIERTGSNRKYISSLRDLTILSDLKVLYVIAFPDVVSNSAVKENRDNTEQVIYDQKMMGLLVAAKRCLTNKELKYLWAVSDVLFYEYVEEVYINEKMKLGDRTGLYGSKNDTNDGETKPESDIANSEGKLKKSIFISYARKDSDDLTILLKYLKELKFAGHDFSYWFDQNIKPGEEWGEEIKAALLSSNIAILLVSQDFLSSDFVNNKELPSILDSYKEKGLTLLPLIIKPCAYKYSRLEKFNAINDLDRPISQLNDNDRNKEYEKLLQYIKSEIEK